ncbi:MAG: glycoside hydrolase family 18 protein [Oscillospiraceae bacterium]|jgi:chitinase
MLKHKAFRAFPALMAALILTLPLSPGRAGRAGAGPPPAEEETAAVIRTDCIPAPGEASTEALSTQALPAAGEAGDFTDTGEEDHMLVVGYYDGMAADRGFTPLKIDAENIDVILYAFAAIGGNMEVVIKNTVDTSNFAELRELKKAYPHLKTMISVGGWRGSGRFSDAALSEESREIFAGSAVKFLKKYDFDGIDIDWEFPVYGGLETNSNRAEDRENYTLLLEELRKKLDKQGEMDGKQYLLSFAGGAGSGYTENTELPKMAEYVDFATIMTYDLHGGWEPYTDFNAPLRAHSQQSPQSIASADQSVKLWIEKGFPASKIVLGVPFYGYVYSCAEESEDGLYAKHSGFDTVSYDKIMTAFLPQGEFTRYVSELAQVPWLYNGSIFISYDDEQSLGEKAGYAVRNGLGGVSIWELSQNADGRLLDALVSNLD